jgi:hypothetical protein
MLLIPFKDIRKAIVIRTKYTFAQTSFDILGLFRAATELATVARVSEHNTWQCEHYTPRFADLIQ